MANDQMREALFIQVLVQLQQDKNGTLGKWVFD
jgi:hypothetical protein